MEPHAQNHAAAPIFSLPCPFKYPHSTGLPDLAYSMHGRLESLRHAMAKMPAAAAQLAPFIDKPNLECRNSMLPGIEQLPHERPPPQLPNLPGLLMQRTHRERVESDGREYRERGQDYNRDHRDHRENEEQASSPLSNGHSSVAIPQSSSPKCSPSQNSAIKKRTPMKRKVIVAWRKYGEKWIQCDHQHPPGTKLQRLYYRCNSPGCTVKKQMENMFVPGEQKWSKMTITGSHNHTSLVSRTPRQMVSDSRTWVSR